MPRGSALEGLLLPQPPGKEYRLLKIVTQVLPHGCQRRPINSPALAIPAHRSFEIGRDVFHRVPISGRRSSAALPENSTQVGHSTFNIESVGSSSRVWDSPSSSLQFSASLRLCG